MTTTGFSLLDFILNLLKNPQAQQQFQEHPQQVLQQHGFDNLCAQDVHDILPLVADQAQGVRSYDGGSQHAAPPVQTLPGETPLDGAVRQLQYITNNYTADSHNVVLDNSVNQSIWSLGDVHQDFNNSPVVANAGGIAAGHNIDGPAVSGDHNVLGNGNQLGNGDVAGNGNLVHNGAGATTFGSGTATDVGAVNADHGSAVSFGSGDAHSTTDSHATNADITNFGSGNNSAITGANGTTAQNHTQDSHNMDVHDSHNNTTTDTDINSHNTDSHNPVDVHSTDVTNTVSHSFNHVTGDHQTGLINVDHVLEHNPVDILGHVL